MIRTEWVESRPVRERVSAGARVGIIACADCAAACGTGLFAVEAARRGCRVTAVDANPQMLDVLRSKLRSPWERRLEILESGCAGLQLVRREGLSGSVVSILVASHREQVS